MICRRLPALMAAVLCLLAQARGGEPPESPRILDDRRVTFLLNDAGKFHALLAKHGIRAQWTVTAGSHEWSVWRGYLREFAPVLFRKESPPAAPP